MYMFTCLGRGIFLLFLGTLVCYAHSDHVHAQGNKMYDMCHDYNTHYVSVHTFTPYANTLMYVYT